MTTNIKSSNTLQNKLSKFNQKQKDLIFDNLIAIQLTQGCSIGCPDCGLDAKKGIIDYISPKLLEKISAEKKINKQIGLYYASDPFDYEFENKTFLDIYSMFKKKGFHPEVITSIPVGKEKLIFNIVLEDINRSSLNKIISGVSITEFNQKRLFKKFNELDFVKNQKKLDIGYKITFPNKETEIYYQQFNLSDFLAYLNNNHRGLISNYTYEKRLKLGEKNKDNLSNVGLGCMNGTLLTPKGIYNIKTTPVTRKNPTGQKITEITTKDFKVIEYENIYLSETYAQFSKKRAKILRI